MYTKQLLKLLIAIAFTAGAGCSSTDATTDDDSSPIEKGETDDSESESLSGTDDNVPSDSPTDTGDDTGGDSGGTDSETGSDSDTTSLEIDTTGCGNGVIESDEVCDDGNISSQDGCSADCSATEDGYVCAVPGEPCVNIIVCGDGKVTGDETCDDFNTTAGDGCSDTCRLEEGWQCPDIGENCIAAECGDGIIVGKEECDDGNSEGDDGCSESCRVESGWACDGPAEPCHETVCNDGTREGDEPCDDGNFVIGDGCTPFCEKEPDCSEGACVSACGDGFILPGDDEECDDGNLQNNDGCSDECKEEPGFACDNQEAVLADVLDVPITYRDFIALPVEGAKRHPDFEIYSGSLATPGLAEDTLGDDGKMIYTGLCEKGNLSSPEDCPYDEQTTSKEDFDQWYRDVPEVNKTVVTRLSLDRQVDDTYYFESDEFFPLDDAGWVEAEMEEPLDGHNFGFTSELRYWFKYAGNESLVFRGDDDVWVFINNRLAVDIGGLHPSQIIEVTLDEDAATELALEIGKIYEIVLFHAERHTAASRYNLTLSGFTTIQSQCEAKCGDGIVAGDETCDDKVNDGSYGSCMPDCTRGPRCGDGEVQEEGDEVCDDGINLTVYSLTGEPGCAPGCKEGAWCGDSVLNSLFGEQCDDGTNEGGYGKCTPECRLDIRCGDGVVQAEHGEECDDGNSIADDECTLDCKKQIIHVE